MHGRLRRVRGRLPSGQGGDPLGAEEPARRTPAPNTQEENARPPRSSRRSRSAWRRWRTSARSGRRSSPRATPSAFSGERAGGADRREQARPVAAARVLRGVAVGGDVPGAARSPDPEVCARSADFSVGYEILNGDASIASSSGKCAKTLRDRGSGDRRRRDTSKAERTAAAGRARREPGRPGERRRAAGRPPCSSPRRCTSTRR